MASFNDMTSRPIDRLLEPFGCDMVFITLNFDLRYLKINFYIIDIAFSYDTKMRK